MSPPERGVIEGRVVETKDVVLTGGGALRALPADSDVAKSSDFGPNCDEADLLNGFEEGIGEMAGMLAAFGSAESE